jgi:hypothetical protein
MSTPLDTTMVRPLTSAAKKLPPVEKPAPLPSPSKSEENGDTHRNGSLNNNNSNGASSTHKTKRKQHNHEPKKKKQNSLEFVYLMEVDRNSAVHNPYNLMVVPHSEIDPNDFYTKSSHGVTHLVNGVAGNESFVIQSLPNLQQKVIILIFISI